MSCISLRVSGFLTSNLHPLIWFIIRWTYYHLDTGQILNEFTITQKKFALFHETLKTPTHLFPYSYSITLHINSLTKIIIYLIQPDYKLISLLNKQPRHRKNVAYPCTSDHFWLLMGILIIPLVCHKHHSNIPKQVLICRFTLIERQNC